MLSVQAPFAVYATFFANSRFVLQNTLIIAMIKMFIAQRRLSGARSTRLAKPRETG
jgi:hypothetical protein